MTINEAIVRLRELHGELVGEERLEKADSVRLGIEALKRVKDLRQGLFIRPHGLLLGETEV